MKVLTQQSHNLHAERLVLAQKLEEVFAADIRNLGPVCGPRRQLRQIARDSLAEPQHDSGPGLLEKPLAPGRRREKKVNFSTPNQVQAQGWPSKLKYDLAFGIGPRQTNGF
jgi:hypothetical protein